MTSSNAHKVAADLAAWSTYTADATHNTVTHHGALLQTAIKRNASEARTNPRPSPSPEGPRALTGDYRGSITRQTTRLARRTICVVGTNKVQGPRLELGFDGIDAAGRTVHAQPYPHFGPGLDEIAPGFEADLNRILPPPGGVR